MNHEDMFRLHLAGIGKYKGNELIVDAFLTVEFMDGFNKYAVRQYYSYELIDVFMYTEYSRGTKHGKFETYFPTGVTSEMSNFVNGKKKGKNVVFSYAGDVTYRTWF